MASAITTATIIRITLIAITICLHEFVFGLPGILAYNGCAFQPWTISSLFSIRRRAARNRGVFVPGERRAPPGRWPAPETRRRPYRGLGQRRISRRQADRVRPPANRPAWPGRRFRACAQRSWRVAHKQPIHLRNHADGIADFLKSLRRIGVGKAKHAHRGIGFACLVIVLGCLAARWKPVYCQQMSARQ